MKKFFLSLIFFLFLLVFMVNAQNLPRPTGWQNLEEIFQALTGFIFYFALALAGLVFLIGGFYLITSGGDPAKVRGGKTVIMYGIIGLIIIFFARGILTLIQNLLMARSP